LLFNNILYTLYLMSFDDFVIAIEDYIFNISDTDKYYKYRLCYIEEFEKKYLLKNIYRLIADPSLSVKSFSEYIIPTCKKYNIQLELDNLQYSSNYSICEELLDLIDEKKILDLKFNNIIQLSKKFGNNMRAFNDCSNLGPFRISRAQLFEFLNTSKNIENLIEFLLSKVENIINFTIKSPNFLKLIKRYTKLEYTLEDNIICPFFEILLHGNDSFKLQAYDIMYNNYFKYITKFPEDVSIMIGLNFGRIPSHSLRRHFLENIIFTTYVTIYKEFHHSRLYEYDVLQLILKKLTEHVDVNLQNIQMEFDFNMEDLLNIEITYDGKKENFLQFVCELVKDKNIECKIYPTAKLITKINSDNMCKLFVKNIIGYIDEVIQYFPKQYYDIWKSLLNKEHIKNSTSVLSFLVNNQYYDKLSTIIEDFEYKQMPIINMKPISLIIFEHTGTINKNIALQPLPLEYPIDAYITEMMKLHFPYEIINNLMQLPQPQGSEINTYQSLMIDWLYDDLVMNDFDSEYSDEIFNKLDDKSISELSNDKLQKLIKCNPPEHIITYIPLQEFYVDALFEYIIDSKEVEKLMELFMEGFKLLKSDKFIDIIKKLIRRNLNNKLIDNSLQMCEIFVNKELKKQLYRELGRFDLLIKDNDLKHPQDYIVLLNDISYYEFTEEQKSIINSYIVHYFTNPIYRQKIMEEIICKHAINCNFIPENMLTYKINDIKHYTTLSNYYWNLSDCKSKFLIEILFDNLINNNKDISLNYISETLDRLVPLSLGIQKLLLKEYGKKVYFKVNPELYLQHMIDNKIMYLEIINNNLKSVNIFDRRPNSLDKVKYNLRKLLDFVDDNFNDCKIVYSEEDILESLRIVNTSDYDTLNKLKLSKILLKIPFKLETANVDGLGNGEYNSILLLTRVASLKNYILGKYPSVPYKVTLKPNRLLEQIYCENNDMILSENKRAYRSNPFNLDVAWRIGYEGSEGLDAGGLHREFFMRCREEILKENIFIFTDEGYVLTDKEHPIIRFIGKLIAKCILLDKQTIGLPLHISLIMHILKKNYAHIPFSDWNILLNDQMKRQIDFKKYEAMYKYPQSNYVSSLVKRNGKLWNIDTFNQYDRKDDVYKISTKDNANYNKYVGNIISIDCIDKINKNYESFRDGFLSIAGENIKMFTPSILYELINGRLYTIADLLTKTSFETKVYDCDHIFTLIEELCKEHKEFENLFIRFWCGSDNIPYEFTPKIQEIMRNEELKNKAPIVARTCFYALQIPIYDKNEIDLKELRDFYNRNTFRNSDLIYLLIKKRMYDSVMHGYEILKTTGDAFTLS